MNVDNRLTEISDCLYRIAIKAVIIENHKLLTTLEPEGWYALPGGGLEYGENPLEGLRREIYEELGLQPDQIIIGDKPVHITNSGIVNGIPRYNMLYKVRILGNGRIDGNELQYKWISATELQGLEVSPSIEAAKEWLLGQLLA